ncbi:MAG: glycosyltransferase [Thermoleophilia bacterium]
MIFVTVGTAEPFDRLLAALEPLPGDEELLVQYGSSTVRPTRATLVDYLPYADLADAVRRARAVVTHGGVGSVLTALTLGRRPVVVPRLRRFGEAVDDHQLEFARRLEQRGLVDLVEDVAALPALLASDRGAAGTVRFGGALATELRAYLIGDDAVPSVTRPGARAVAG